MAIQGISLARGLLAVDYLKNATSVVEVFDASAGSAIFANGALSGAPAKSLGELAMPGIGSAGLATEPDRTEAYLKFTSFNYPTTIFRVDLARPALEPGALGAPAGAGRSFDRRGQAGLVQLEGRHEGQHVRGAP
jgi:hypothetical protein